MPACVTIDAIARVEPSTSGTSAASRPLTNFCPRRVHRGTKDSSTLSETLKRCSQLQRCTCRRSQRQRRDSTSISDKSSKRSGDVIGPPTSNAVACSPAGSACAISRARPSFCAAKRSADVGAPHSPPQALSSTRTARPPRLEQTKPARSSRQFSRFCHAKNPDKVFGTHRL
jgi:hypothetical protein